MEPPSDVKLSKAAASTTSMLDAVSAADERWYETTKEQIFAILHTEIADGNDSEIRSQLSELSKNAVKTLTSVKARKRSIKRRTHANAEEGVKQADELEDLLMLLSDFHQARVGKQCRRCFLLQSDDSHRQRSPLWKGDLCQDC